MRVTAHARYERTDSRENALAPSNNTNRKALLIHVVRVAQLNIILLHLIAQNSKVRSVLFIGISSVPYRVHCGGPFRNKDVRIVVNEARNPTF
jgi:hypothetical protein